MKKYKGGGGLKPQKMTRQKTKLLCKMVDGGQTGDIMMDSLQQKMTLGSDAKRLAKKADGSEQMQSYKMGGWTHSGK
jgi:hypothetical protein|tara:strand:+ start:443 stop:673 length:231 start_codon:yes stop_codon:yes gene_type:complete